MANKFSLILRCTPEMNALVISDVGLMCLTFIFTPLLPYRKETESQRCYKLSKILVKLKQQIAAGCAVAKSFCASICVIYLAYEIEKRNSVVAINLRLSNQCKVDQEEEQL